MADSPLISVLLPFRDAAPTLAEALQSILRQEGPPLELIAVDDGSADGGAAIAAEIARRDTRLRVLAGAGNGIVSALRLATEHARGSLVARMDADDISLPGRLASQARALDADPSLALVSARVENFGATPAGAGLERYVAWQNAVLSPAEHDLAIFIESPICHPSVMLRRSALDAVGGYADTPWAEDYDLWLRLWAAGRRMAKLPEVLVRWRHHDGRLTTTDPRYSPEMFRRAKAHYLAPWLRARGRPLSIWGAGPFGRRVARALEAHDVRPERFLDIDPRKIGRTARGAPITSTEQLDASAEVLLVCVGSPGARQIITTELNARGFVDGDSYRCVH